MCIYIESFIVLISSVIYFSCSFKLDNFYTVNHDDTVETNKKIVGFLIALHSFLMYINAFLSKCINFDRP